MEYDIIIIGTTIDRITAAIYALKLGKKVLLIESGNLKEYVLQYEEIKDYSLKKYVDLAKSKDEILKLGGTIKFEEIIKINNQEVITDKCIYKTKAIIIATGARHKLLGLENENKFIGNGIHFCISCDAPFYKEEIGCVVGSNEDALKSALNLSNICSKVIIINEKAKLYGNENMLEKIYNKNNIKIYNKTSIISLSGDRKLQKIRISNEEQMNIDCIFLSNGFIPNIEKINIKNCDNTIFVIDEMKKNNNRDGISVAKKAINFINKGK